MEAITIARRFVELKQTEQAQDAYMLALDQK